MNSTKVQEKSTPSKKKSNLQKITERLDAFEQKLDKYKKGNILSNKILDNTEPLTFYEAIKEVQTIAIDSGNGDRLEYHNYYLEMLREYFLDLHFKDEERQQNEQEETRNKLLYSIYSELHDLLKRSKGFSEEVGNLKRVNQKIKDTLGDI